MPRNDFIIEFKKDDISEKTINRGDVYQIKDDKSGRNFQSVVTKVKRNSVIIDFNHVAAGKTLVFKVKIHDIENN